MFQWTKLFQRHLAPRGVLKWLPKFHLKMCMEITYAHCNIKLWVRWDCKYHRNSSIPKHHHSAGYIICQACAKWICGFPHSKNRKKKAFFLSSFLWQSFSWPIMMFSIGYIVILLLAWSYSYREWRPCPETHCSRCKGVPTSRPHMVWKVAAVASLGQAWAGQQPVWGGESRGSSMHHELSKYQVHAPFSHQTSLRKLKDKIIEDFKTATTEH